MKLRTGGLLAIACVWLALAVALVDAFSATTAWLLPGLLWFTLRNPPRALGLLVLLAPGLAVLTMDAALYAAAPVFESLLICTLLVWLARLALRGHFDFELRLEDRLVLGFFALSLASAAHAVWLRADAPGYFQFPLDLYFNLGQPRFVPTGPSIASTWLPLLTPGPIVEETLRPLLTLLEAVVVYFFVRNEVRGEAWHALGGWIVATLGLVVLIGTAAYASVDNAAHYEGVRRATGLFCGPNVFASYLLLGLPIAAARLGRSFGGALSALALLLGLACLVWTRSRGAMAGMAVVALLGAAALLREPVMAHARAIRNALLGAFVVAASVGAPICHYGPASQLNGATGGRYYLWRGGVEMVRSHPLTGVGLGNFARDLRDYYPTGVAAREAHEHAHSWFLQVAGEQGVVALAALLALFGVVLWRAARRLPTAPPGLVGLALAVTGTLVHSLFDYTLLVVVVSFEFWIVVALLVTALERQPAEATAWSRAPAGPSPRSAP
jgi:O-antigen ligase